MSEAPNYRKMANDLNEPALKCVSHVLDKAMSGVLEGVHEEVRRLQQRAERAEAECERLRSNVETLKELLGAAIRSGGEPAAQAVDALLASREDDGREGK